MDQKSKKGGMKMARKKKKDEAVIVEIGLPEQIKKEVVLEEMAFISQPVFTPKSRVVKPPPVINERSPLTGEEKFKLVCVRKAGLRFRREVLAIGSKETCQAVQRKYEARILKGELSRNQRLVLKRMPGRI